MHIKHCSSPLSSPLAAQAGLAQSKTFAEHYQEDTAKSDAEYDLALAEQRLADEKKPRSARLNSLLKFKIYSKSFENHDETASKPSEATNQPKQPPIQVIINSPSSSNTSPLILATHVTANSALSIKSSCSTPFLPNSLKSLGEKSSQVSTAYNGEKKRVSLPTPINFNLDQQQNQQQQQSNSNLSQLHGRLSFDDEYDNTDNNTDNTDYYDDDQNTTDDHDQIDGEEEDEQLCYSLSRLDNPFLLFVCMAIFMEKRQHILKHQLDANDIACYFDKMTRKHDVKSVLNRARHLYTKLYLSKANLFNYIHHAMEIENSP